MIINGRSGVNRAFWAKHLMNTRKNDRVRVVGFRGVAADTVAGALREWEGEARGTRCKNFFYEVSISPDEGEWLTDAQVIRSADIAEEPLGLQGQPRFIVIHEKDGERHAHVFWLRVTEDGKVISDSLTYPRHEAAARQMEQEFGLRKVASVLVKNRGTERPERRPHGYVNFRGSESGLDFRQVKEEVTGCWRKTQTGEELRRALLASGYITCRGDRRDFVLIDPAGNDHSLPRCITGAKAADVRERMRDIVPATLPSVAQGRAMANEWGDSEAARAVRMKSIRDGLAPFLAVTDTGQEETPEDRERRDRKRRKEYQPAWVSLHREPKAERTRDAVTEAAREQESPPACMVLRIPDRWSQPQEGRKDLKLMEPGTFTEKEQQRKRGRNAPPLAPDDRPWGERVQLKKALEHGQ